MEKLKNLPKIVFNNEDHSFKNFIKTFYEKGQFSQGNASLRCKKSTCAKAIGNKFKKVDL
jgi:hypothetical protein